MISKQPSSVAHPTIPYCLFTSLLGSSELMLEEGVRDSSTPSLVSVHHSILVISLSTLDFTFSIISPSCSVVRVMIIIQMSQVMIMILTSLTLLSSPMYTCDFPWCHLSEMGLFSPTRDAPKSCQQGTISDHLMFFWVDVFIYFIYSFPATCSCNAVFCCWEALNQYQLLLWLRIWDARAPWFLAAHVGKAGSCPRMLKHRHAGHLHFLLFSLSPPTFSFSVSLHLTLLSMLLSTCYLTVCTVSTSESSTASCHCWPQRNLKLVPFHVSMPFFHGKVSQE